jgi:hypothetical protein
MKIAGCPVAALVFAAALLTKADPIVVLNSTHNLDCIKVDCDQDEFYATKYGHDIGDENYSRVANRVAECISVRDPALWCG